MCIRDSYQAFTQGRIDWGGAIATYIGIPLFLLTWLGYRLVKKSRFVRWREMRFVANEDLPAAQNSSVQESPSASRHTRTRASEA